MTHFIAETERDLPDVQTVLSMSGLEFMRGILEGRLPAPPIAGRLEYRLDTVEDGRVVFRGTPRFPVCNPMGTVHGGWSGHLNVISGPPEGLQWCSGVGTWVACHLWAIYGYPSE